MGLKLDMSSRLVSDLMIQCLKKLAFDELSSYNKRMSLESPFSSELTAMTCFAAGRAGSQLTVFCHKFRGNDTAIGSSFFTTVIRT